MAFEVVMPRQGWTMEVGSVVEWFKHDGDAVKAGEIIFTIQSDKVINEIEALDSGILRIPPDSPAPGVEVPIGTVLGYIVAPGEPPPFGDAPPMATAEAPAGARVETAAAPPAASQGQVAATGGSAASGAAVSTTITPATTGRRRDGAPPISPRARRIAAELGVEWQALRGSGRTGRIVERDVRASGGLTRLSPPSRRGDVEVGGREKGVKMAIEAAREADSAPSKDVLLGLFRQMVHIRRTEEALARLHQQGLVHGACHTYVGEEAIATGVCAHLRTEDTVFSTHRGHGHALAKGASAREVAAELLGRDTGCSRGRGGSMHLFKPEVGMMGTSGIVGPCITLAAGSAYAFKLLGTDRVGVAFFGDGASNNGAFHEGINMASAWRLPVLFVCENNQYATEVPFATVARVEDIAARAVGYGLPGITVDGNDVLAVFEAAGEAIRRARAGEGPTLIECKTYRTRPHSEGMRDTGYRTQDEIDAWKARDPIKRLHSRLVTSMIATEHELAAIEAEVDALVADAVDFARNSPWPDPATVMANIYSE